MICGMGLQLVINKSIHQTETVLLPIDETGHWIFYNNKQCKCSPSVFMDKYLSPVYLSDRGDTLHISVWSIGWCEGYKAHINVEPSLGRCNAHINMKSGLGEMQYIYLCEAWSVGDAMHISVWSLVSGRCNAHICVKPGWWETQCTYQCEAWVGGDTMHLSVWSLRSSLG